MMLPVKKGDYRDPRACTRDHLFQQYNPDRRRAPSGERVVAACMQCNQIRGRADKIHAIVKGWMKSAHPLGNAMESFDTKFVFDFGRPRESDHEAAQ